ncbi:MAG: branched-chain amino acid ABC transporter permease [Candidatus Dormibacteraeota bacterium]|nr:branched-chain amino acid ABC transporter permease [Candidatus Dormibacteraeota bacterium]
MSSATQYYVSALAIYACIDIMACWGLNLQFGVAGIYSFGFIAFQAVGAYTAGVLTLGPDTGPLSFQTYIGGAQLPFPVAVLCAGAAGAILALVVGAITFRRLRSDYQAMVMLTVALIATSIVVTQPKLVNGEAGLSLIPQPYYAADASPVGYQWFYLGITALVTAIVFFVVHRVTRSPWGRSLRAMRDDDSVASALGKNVWAMRMIVFAIGGAIAAVSGAMLVAFIGAFSPSGWAYGETFVLFTALVIGGIGNNFGVAVGAVLVPLGLVEGTRFLPTIGRIGLNDELQWICIGLLLLGFLWFAPRGLFPERRRRLGARSERPAWLPRILSRPEGP